MALIPIDREVEVAPIEPRQRDDPKFAAGKVAVFQYFIVAVFLFLISGFWGLQVQNLAFYSERAERNRIRTFPMPAPRGKILDRDGRIIVDNHTSFSLIISRENLRADQVKALADGLNLDYGELTARLKRFASRPGYDPIIVKDDLTRGELAYIEAHRGMDGYPEMELIPTQRRLYPQNGIAAHLIGYVGEVSEAELNSREWAKYNPGDVIGKAGIERYYNEHLMGKDGQRRVVVDNRNNQREVLGIKEPEPGKNLQLSIDLDLQVVAELSLEGKKGAVVALDPRNGDVLAMASSPTFDPNLFAGRIPAKDWQEIVNDPGNPLLERAIQAQVAPGSTFKPIVALAGLELGDVDPNYTVHCTGGATYYGRYFHCSRRKGHGNVDLHDAIAQSCDVYFYALGNKIGIDGIAKYAHLAGLGQKTGIDLPQEKAGVVPSSQWKIRNYREKWYAGETISVAIGQGALEVTPLQLAYAIGGLANGGAWVRPHVLMSPSTPPAVRRAELNPEHLAEVLSGMCAVVEEGTGTFARLSNVEVCGKTGSAQLVSNELIRSGKLSTIPKDNAWFVGFAPRESPEIVVAVLCEGGVHGGVTAAPIARDVMKAYFDKKARRLSNRELNAAGGPNVAAVWRLRPPVPVGGADTAGFER